VSVDLNQYRKPVVEEKQSQSELWKLLNKDISFGRKKISDKFKEYFYSELGLLLESGLDIQQALDLIEQDQKSALNKKLTRSLNEQVTGGRSLSDALEESTYFDTFEVNTLRIGEETGNLAMVTKELSIHFQRKQELKRQLIGVFAYPAFVLFVSVGVVYFMLN
jgi:type IV pilus assembly protein PilC